MRVYLFLFCLSLTALSLADSQEKILLGPEARFDLIADNYEAGPFLIYDCVEGHYVCVLESFYQECQAKRAEDIKLNKVQARCAPFGNFPNKISCFQRQLFMTGHNHGTHFCVTDSWKKKEIKID
jgi:hypothetical protein